MSLTAPELSVLLPAFNEAENLPVIWSELGPVLDALARPAEVIFVDDGSADATPEIVRSIRAADARVRLVRLAANAGLSAALDAGFQRARGRIIVTLDSDLQNDPRDIPRMLASLEGYDAVTGWRQQRDDPGSSACRRGWPTDPQRDHPRARARQCVHAAGDPERLPAEPAALSWLSSLRADAAAPGRLARAGAAGGPPGAALRGPHYGIRNRAFVAFEDLLAVRWMQDRWLRYEATEEP